MDSQVVSKLSPVVHKLYADILHTVEARGNYVADLLGIHVEVKDITGRELEREFFGDRLDLRFWVSIDIVAGKPTYSGFSCYEMSDDPNDLARRVCLSFVSIYRSSNRIDFDSYEMTNAILENKVGQLELF